MSVKAVTLFLIIFYLDIGLASIYSNIISLDAREERRTQEVVFMLLAVQGLLILVM
jgi:hypothetical protein